MSQYIKPINYVEILHRVDYLSRGRGAPTATIEVQCVKQMAVTVRGRAVTRKVAKTVVQVKASSNNAPTEEVLRAIEIWGLENKITVNVMFLLAGKGHDYNDEGDAPVEDYEADGIEPIRRPSDWCDHDSDNAW
jgi:hypothetical protein